MTGRQRKMRLTQAHVAQVAGEAGEFRQPPIPEGRRFATDEDFAGFVRDILACAPSPGDFWVFAYGSLIWNPEFDHVGQRMALVHGWHRSFCLGWDEWFRGSEGRPGLMLALDRGGRCKGIAFKLPSDALEANLDRLVRREMLIVPHVFPPRWVTARTEDGEMPALTFAMDRKAGAYVGGLSDCEIADALAKAIGPRGSMAEYLFHTVAHLEENGIHDRHLWQLQEMVAERIEGVG
jgi:cation transport protein ChaC